MGNGELFLIDTIKDGMVFIHVEELCKFGIKRIFFQVTNAEIIQIKEELNVELPEKLIELFSETNGVFDSFNCPLIWSTSQIVKDNLFF